MRTSRAALGCALFVVLMVLSMFVSPAARTHAAPGARPAVGCARPDSWGPGMHTRSIDVHGVTRSYRIHIPAGLGGARPLILAFHGHAEQVASFATYTGLSSLPAILVYPNGLRGTDGKLAWQGAPYAAPRADDLAFTRRILTDVAAHVCVNPARVYALGRSNGGGLVATLACQMPGRFAAFATVNGAIYTRGLVGCHPRPISLIDFHGTADTVIRYDGGRRFGGRYLPIPAWLAMWVRADGCVPGPVTVPVNLAVQRQSWSLCSALGHQIVHYRIDGGDHHWPGSVGPGLGSSGPGSTGFGSSATSVPTATLIWQFFLRHTRSGGSS